MPRPRQFDPEEVLDRSMREFWQRGYRETSVDDLVEATGVRPGSLYHAFSGGKRGLFLQALDRYSKLVVPEKLGALERAVNRLKVAEISRRRAGRRIGMARQE